MNENSQHFRANLLDEISLMKSIGYHPHLLSMLGCTGINGIVMIINEYCSLGTLHSKLIQEKGNDLDDQVAPVSQMGSDPRRVDGTFRR